MSKHSDMRVVLCVPGFPTSVDDADKPFLLDHAVALCRAGLKVSVVCPMVNGAPRRHSIGEIEVIRVAYAPRRLQTLASTGSMYREARGLKALLVAPMLFCLTVAMIRQLRMKNTIAYGHWWMPGGFVAAVAARITRRRAVVHLHGSDAAISTTKFLRALASVVIRSADARLAVSSELALWGQQISSHKFQVLSMPLDLERLPDPSPVPAGGFILGVGRLVPEKGFDLLIEAASYIDQEIRPEITIIGLGPDRSNLTALARRLDVKLHLPGAISPKDIGDWYRRASVVVVPSRREGFGMVAAEAAAAGRAVIATRVGAMSEIVENGVSGLLIDPEDPEALCKALLSVDPFWGVQGPPRVTEFGFDVHGKTVRRLCEDLLK